MRWLLVVMAGLGLQVSAWATVLTFSTETGGVLPNQAVTSGPIYGHRVAAEIQNGYQYGSAFGFTPNVSVSYAATPGASPDGWGTGYGDLINVLWGRGPSSVLGDNIITITFTADPGWLVDFRGLSVGRWSSGPYPGSFVSLTNAENVTVDLLTLQQLNTGVSTNLSYSDDTYLSSSFRLQFGSGWWTGIDNVAFEQQPVPEPMTMSLLAAGLVAVASRRRKN